MSPLTPAEIRDALAILCERAAETVAHQRATHGERSPQHDDAQRVAYAWMDALTAMENGLAIKARRAGVA